VRLFCRQVPAVLPNLHREALQPGVRSQLHFQCVQLRPLLPAKYVWANIIFFLVFFVPFFGFVLLSVIFLSAFLRFLLFPFTSSFPEASYDVRLRKTNPKGQLHACYEKHAFQHDSRSRPTKTVCTFCHNLEVVILFFLVFFVPFFDFVLLSVIFLSAFPSFPSVPVLRLPFLKLLMMCS
jgi:hypothetical protein